MRGDIVTSEGEIRICRANISASPLPASFPSVGQAECVRFAMERHIGVDCLFEERWALVRMEEAHRVLDKLPTDEGMFPL